jgi:hypothetical protein
MSRIAINKLHCKVETRGGVFGRAVVLGAVAAAAAFALPRPAAAVPSFAIQTGQPCAACHVGSFGPQLTQFGRDFKLYGYVSNDKKPHLVPLSAMVQGSFTNTQVDQVPSPTPRTGPNNNFTLDQISLFYAGAIIPNTVGAFIQATYDGVADTISWDNADIRMTREGRLFGSDLVWGLTLNNNPTVQDLWNSTPAWGFPYVSSKVAPTPSAAALVNGGLAAKVGGLGAYALWNDLVYVEADAYKQLGHPTLNALGVPVSGQDTSDNVIPYWRLALQHTFGEERHNVQFGTYGLLAHIHPGGDTTTGTTDRLTDTAIDANYQYYFNPKDVTADVLSMHATYIHEDQDLRASTLLSGTNAHDWLNTFRADASYSIGASVTPSVQYFRTWGSNDAARWGTDNGSPNSAGLIAEVGYSPWGKPDSPVSWFNPHFTLQYVAYSQFNGTSEHASDNNTLFLNVWFALGMPR